MSPMLQHFLSATESFGVRSRSGTLSGLLLYGLSSSIHHVVLLTPHFAVLAVVVLKASNVLMGILCAFVFLWQVLFVHE